MPWTTKKSCHCRKTLLNRVHLLQDIQSIILSNLVGKSPKKTSLPLAALSSFRRQVRRTRIAGGHEIFSSLSLARSGQAAAPIPPNLSSPSSTIAPPGRGASLTAVAAGRPSRMPLLSRYGGPSGQSRRRLRDGDAHVRGRPAAARQDGRVKQPRRSRVAPPSRCSACTSSPAARLQLSATTTLAPSSRSARQGLRLPVRHGQRYRTRSRVGRGRLRRRHRHRHGRALGFLAKCQRPRGEEESSREEKRRQQGQIVIWDGFSLKSDRIMLVMSCSKCKGLFEN